MSIDEYCGKCGHRETPCPCDTPPVNGQNGTEREQIMTWVHAHYDGIMSPNWMDVANDLLTPGITVNASKPVIRKIAMILAEARAVLGLPGE